MSAIGRASKPVQSACDVVDLSDGLFPSPMDAASCDLSNPAVRKVDQHASVVKTRSIQPQVVAPAHHRGFQTMRS
jgi:hypothetical protein